MTAVAELSVVIPSVNGATYLVECLGALQQVSASGVALDVIVVDRCGETVRTAARAAYREAVVLDVPPATTIPQMRARGFAVARAAAVAVIEDHVLVPPDWGRVLLGALAAGNAVVGGSVQNAATARLVDRAAFLCEYSHLLAPSPSAAAASVTGNNVVYRRSLLERYAATIAEGRWEDHLHAAMQRDGVALACVPDIIVRHRMHYRVHEYLLQRFLYSRAYAGMRAADMSAVRRASTAVATVALPLLLLVRIVRRVLAAGRQAGELVAALPLLVVFVCAWAAGEAVGYAAGPGDALVRVR